MSVSNFHDFPLVQLKEGRYNCQDGIFLVACSNWKYTRKGNSGENISAQPSGCITKPSHYGEYSPVLLTAEVLSCQMYIDLLSNRAIHTPFRNISKQIILLPSDFSTIIFFFLHLNNSKKSQECYHPEQTEDGEQILVSILKCTNCLLATPKMAVFQLRLF